MSATFYSFCHGQFCENFLELKSPFFTHSALVHLSQHTSSFNNVSSTQFFQKILSSYSHLSLFNSSLFVSKTLPPLTTLSLSLSLSLISKSSEVILFENLNLVFTCCDFMNLRSSYSLRLSTLTCKIFDPE